MVTADTSVRCRGRNGNGSANSAAEMIAIRLITFLATNRFATRSTLPITRRPSASTDGMCENLPSSSTSWATALVACAPLPIATPMSASLRASASLTPSPVIATTCPLRCSACTSARFCSGDTRPKTVVVSAISRSSSGSSPMRAGVDHRVGPSSSPTRRAIAPTVVGLSPEMILTRTPWSLKYCRVSFGVRPDLLGQRHQRHRT